MRDGKDFGDSPPIDSNEPGTTGDEKFEYEKEVGEEASSPPEGTDKESAGREAPVEEGSAEESSVGEEESNSASTRRKRIKVTVQRPEALKELAQTLGSSKAGVYNTALGMLAEEMGVGSS